jgi:hypothetical protein
MRYILTLTLLMTLAHPAVTHAQSAGPRNIEIGGGGGGIFSWWGSPPAGGDVRLSVPVTPRVMFETIVAMTPIEHSEVAGFYGGQMRRSVRRRDDSGFESFITFGAIGAFAHSHNGGTVIVPPLIGLLGGGVQQRVADRLAVRVEAQAVMALVVPVGVRMAAGVSVPLGRLRGR